VVNEGLDGLAAEIWEGLGRPAQAAMIRANRPPAADLSEVRDELINALSAIADAVDDVPESSARHKHTNTCHQSRAQCLAAQVRELIPDTIRE